MKREQEQYILVSSTRVTEILKKLIKDGGEALQKMKITNLSDYSTKFKNIR